MKNFNEVGLPAELTRAIQKMYFVTPTPIQTQAIPVAMEGKDILGTAQTGTGKTAAYGIPLVAKLLMDPKSHALVLTPTRELAIQVMDTVRKLLGDTGLKTALLIGGDSIFKQFNQLKARPRVVVGTPGRIIDHLERKTFQIQRVNFLVLDETDRMLDMGFEIQLKRIAQHLGKERQTLMFSATLPKEIMRVSEKYLNHPVRITVGSTTTPLEKINQSHVILQEGEKYSRLLSELKERAGTVLVFVKTKRGADKLSKRLKGEKEEVDTLHGDLRQNQRERVMNAFRKMKFRVLVATDVASRGLDVPHIAHVINYDLPQTPEDYIHRIGRTARAENDGSAITLLTSKDKFQWREIQRLLDPNYKDLGGSYKRPDHGARDSRGGQGGRRRGGRGRSRSRH